MQNLKFPIGDFTKTVSISNNDLKNWILVIENFPNRIKSLTEKLSIEQLNWVYRPNGWTIKQVVHHCADSHMNSLIRFKLALTEENPTIKPYNEANWANLFDGVSDDISSSIQIIEGIHKRWVLLLSSFEESHFKRTFIIQKIK
jgi:DinB superfamily